MLTLGRLLALFAAGLAAVVGTATVTAARSAGAAGGDLPALEGVEFVVVCTFSHRAPDDPIVFPGKPGLSHGHTFFGNTATDASSTAYRLRGGATTCDHADDLGAYWIPTLPRRGSRCRSARREDLLPAGDSRQGACVPAGPRDDWRQRGVHVAAEPADHVLGLRRAGRRRAGEQRADLPGRSLARPAALGQVPRLLGRQAHGQRRPPFTHGLFDRLARVRRRIPSRCRR